jgi:hypothetical protein
MSKSTRESVAARQWPGIFLARAVKLLWIDAKDVEDCRGDLPCFDIRTVAGSRNRWI